MTDPMSQRDALAASDVWWRDVAPSIEYREEYRGEDGGIYVVVYAMCALSGGIVGLVIGLLLS